VIKNAPLPSAVDSPRELLPLNSSTVLPASAVPTISGVLSLVVDVVVVIDGVLGKVVSISIVNPADATDSFPATSVDLTVSV
jgi:hypothetical protein